MDQFYFEEGYLEASYFTVIREAEAALPMAVTVSAQGDIADTTGYYIPDYIVTDYFESGGQLLEADAAFTVSATQAVTVERITEAAATVSVTVTKVCTVTRIRDSAAAFTAAFAPTLTADAFKNHTAVLDSVSTMSVDAVANRSANVLLDYIADLNAMAAKTVNVVSTATVTATQSTTATKTVSPSISLSSSAAITCILGEVHSAQSQVTVVSSLKTSRYFGSNRPRNLSAEGDGFDFNNYFSNNQLDTSSLAGSEFIQFASPRGSIVPKANQSWVFSFEYQSLGTTRANGFLAVSFLTETDSDTFANLRQLDSTGTSWRLDLFKTGQATVSQTFTAGSSLTKIAVAYENGYVGIFTGNTRVALINLSSLTAVNWQRYNELAKPRFSLARNVVFDEFHFATGTRLEYNPQSSSVSATGTQTNQPATTQALYHFTGNGLDDIAVTESAQSALQSAFTQQTINTGTFVPRSAEASLSSTVTLSAQGDRPASAAADLVSATAVTAVVERIRLGDSGLNTVTAVTAVIGSVKQFDCDAGALFAPQITVTAQLAGVALLETVSTVTAQAVKTTDPGATLNTITSMSVSATVSAELASVQTVTTAATVTVTRARETVVDLDTAVSVTADSLKIAGVDCTAATSTALIATADKLKLAAADFSTVITAVTTAQKTTAVTVSVVSEFTQVTDYIRIRSADITESVAVTVTASPVKTPSIGAAITVSTAVTAQAVKTVDPVVPFGALFAPQITADITARPLVFLETSSAVTVQPGYLIQYPPTELFSTGLDTSTGSYEIENVPPVSYNPDFGSGYVMAFWAKRDTVAAGNYAYNMLAPTTFGTSAGQYNLLQFKNGTGPTSGGITRSYAHSITLFTPWNLQTNPYWDNTVSQDTDWHHYLIRYFPVSSGLDTLDQYTLFVDGVSQGTSNGSNAHRVNDSGGVYFGTGWSSSNPTANLVAAGNFDGAMAQVWLGGVTNFNIEQFYRTNTDSAVDLTGFESPEQYNLLTDPWTGVTAGDNTTLTASTEPLFNGRIHSKFTISGSVVGVFLFEIPLSAVTGLACTASAILRTGQNLTVTVTQTVTATTAIGIVADLPVEFAQHCTVFRIQTADSAIAAAFTQTVQPGLFELATADLVSTAILDAGVDSIPPTRGEAELSSSFQLTAQVTSFTDSITLLVTAGTLTADVTVIPPVRVEADLVVTASMSVTIGSIEQFAVLTVSSGTLSCSAVKTADIESLQSVTVTQNTESLKFTGIIADFTAFNTQLTVGEIINIDPFLQLKIEPETRTLKIAQETRVLSIESETRVNIIKD